MLLRHNSARTLQWREAWPGRSLSQTTENLGEISVKIEILTTRRLKSLHLLLRRNKKTLSIFDRQSSQPTAVAGIATRPDQTRLAGTGLSGE